MMAGEISDTLDFKLKAKQVSPACGLYVANLADFDTGAFGTMFPIELVSVAVAREATIAWIGKQPNKQEAAAQ